MSELESGLKHPYFSHVVGGYQDTRDGKVFQMRYDLKVLSLTHRNECSTHIHMFVSFT